MIYAVKFILMGTNVVPLHCNNCLLLQDHCISSTFLYRLSSNAVKSLGALCDAY
jgi:hypothetical protein